MQFKKIQSYVFIGLLIGVTIAFFWMLRPYIYAIFWAAVVATLFYPVNKFILKKVGKTRKPLAASITMVLAILVFLIPLAGIASLVANQAVNIYQEFGNEDTYNQVNGYLESTMESPYVKDLVGQIDIQEKLSEWSSDISGYAYKFLTSWGQNTLQFVIQFFIMLYALYYFIKDGEYLLKKLMYIIPLGDKNEKKLYSDFVSTAKATLKGTLLIGLIQGVIGALAFLVTGIPGFAFWGLVMVLLSIIPSVGASLVLVPAAVIMFLLGNIWQAIVIVIFVVVVSLVDNFLRVPLVGKDIQMHPLFIFFATLGGLLAFGISGIIIGPIITSFLLSIWGIYKNKYKDYLDIAD